MAAPSLQNGPPLSVQTSAPPFKQWTILDVLAEQKLIPAPYIIEIEHILHDKLLKTHNPNDLIATYLLHHHYATETVLAQAYAFLYHLPYVNVGHIEIPHEVISLIPEKLAKRYGIIIYQAAGTIIDICISRPENLRGHYHGIFRDLAHEHGVIIRLAVTSPEEFKSALNWYRWNRPVGRVRLYEHHLDSRALNRLPTATAQSLRLLVYEEVPTIFTSIPIFRVATDRVKDRTLEKTLRFIEDKNHVALALYQTSKEDIDAALAVYPDLLSEPPSSSLTVKDLVNRQQQLTAIAKQTVVPPVPPSAMPPTPAPVKVAKEPSKSLEAKLIAFFEKLFHLGKKANSITLTPPTFAPSPAASASPIAPPEEKKLKLVAAAQEEPIAKEPVTPSSTERYMATKKHGKVLNVHLPTEAGEDGKKPKNIEKERPAVAPIDDLEELTGRKIESIKDLEDLILESRIPPIVAGYLDYALKLDASDVHVEVDDERERVRLRVDGILRDVVALPKEMHPAIISRIKILSGMKIDEQRLPQDGRFTVGYRGREVDLRVSALPTAYGEKIVMRLLDKEKGVLSIENLGLMGKGRADLDEAHNKPYGIILATGPTGSGKSTTLYSILGILTKPGVNICTLEDPIEFEMSGINQSQIRPQIGFTFAAGLRSLMRQDPNIIMVGEIRDLETATNATHAALTGHLVLSTLHTNDAVGALPRLISMGVEPFLITASINAVIGQRLVRKVCEHCKQPVELPPALVKDVEEEFAKIPTQNTLDQARIIRPLTFWQGKGCDQCTDGYKGRIGIYEVMPMSEELETLAGGRSSADQLSVQAKKEGMITMKQDGYLKAIAGITTVEEVLRETKMD